MVRLGTIQQPLTNHQTSNCAASLSVGGAGRYRRSGVWVGEMRCSARMWGNFFPIPQYRLTFLTNRLWLYCHKAFHVK